MAKTPSSGTPKKKDKKKTSTEPAGEKENQDTTKRTQWTKTSDGIMCDTLLVQKNNGFQTDNGGFQAASWNEVKNALKGTEKTDGGAEKSVPAAKARYDTLKRLHRSFKEAMNLSGAGWCEVTGCLIVSDDVWKDYIKNHPKATDWRITPFHMWEKMTTLIDGQVATGQDAFVPGMEGPATQSHNEDSSPQDGDMGQAGDDEGSHGMKGGDNGIESEQENDATEREPDLMAAPTIVPSQKRLRAETDSPESGSSSHKAKRHLPRKLSTGQGMAAISSSLDRVATSMTASSNPKSAADEAIEEAIKTVLELPDQEMDQDEQVRVFQLFRADEKIAVFFQMMVARGKLQTGLAYLRRELKNVVE